MNYILRLLDLNIRKIETDDRTLIIQENLIQMHQIQFILHSEVIKFDPIFEVL